MKKGKSALIIFIFMVLAILILLVLLPFVLQNNNEVNNINLNNKEGNGAILSDEEIQINNEENNEYLSNIDIEDNLKVERETQIDEQINIFSPIPAQEGEVFVVTNLKWIADDIALVDFQGEEDYQAEFEFDKGTASILLVTQVIEEDLNDVNEE